MKPIISIPKRSTITGIRVNKEGILVADNKPPKIMEVVGEKGQKIAEYVDNEREPRYKRILD